MELNTKARFFPLKYPRSEVTCQDDMDMKKRLMPLHCFWWENLLRGKKKNHVLKEAPNPSLVSLLPPTLCQLILGKNSDSDLDI